MNNASTTLVVARYEEDLEWLTEVPSHFKVVVYNKGRLISSLSALDRIDLLLDRENIGRESETYLNHIANCRDDPNEWTVFCQGNPFEHSPDFLDLLRAQDCWKDRQTLSCQWVAEMNIPPRNILDAEQRENIGGLRIRSETFSLFLWSAISFADGGSLGHRSEYARFHHLHPGENIASHFLRLAGLEQIADRADLAQCGIFAYGAIFACKTELAAAIDSTAVSALIGLACGPAIYGYIIERMWLHLMGSPFLKLDFQTENVI